MKKKYILFLFIIGFHLIVKCQNNGLVFKNNCYVVITNSANLVIDNPNATAITNIGGANIISEGEYNVVKWNISLRTCSYIVPFATNSLVKMQLIVTVGSENNYSIL